MRSRPRIVFPDGSVEALRILDGEFRDRLDALGEFVAYESAPATPADYVDRVREADGILLGWHLPDEALEAASDLQVISFIGGGPEAYVNMQLARRLDVGVAACPGYGDNAVAEHTIALLFSLVRGVPAHDAAVRAGVWDQGDPVPELRGATMGIVGYGGIGARVAESCVALGMQVLCWNWPGFPSPNEDSAVQSVPFDELLARSDAVALHLRLTDETQGLIGAGEFDQMKPTALLINTARGPLVDEAALVERLSSGRIGGAALDVFSEEPVAPGHPLTQLPNVVLTPHVAFNTLPATRAVFDIAIGNLVSFFAGQPINVVSE